MKSPSRSRRPSVGVLLALCGMTIFMTPGFGQERAPTASGTSALTALPTWISTGNLNSPRLSHTATLLPSGNVLVVGGSTSTTFSLNSAELYDVATGKWSATGPLTSARVYHTATLLANGRVLVVGGGNYNPIRSVSSELYDPATGTWSATGSPIEIQDGHTATLLPSGKVLIVAPALDFSSTSAELYDPMTGRWLPSGAPTSIHAGHTATLLQNGKVLVAGGFYLSASENGEPLAGPPSKAELYDPVFDSWREVGTDVFTGGHTATLLPNGRVLMAGGSDTSRGARLYDPITETFSPTGALNEERIGHTATLLPNGKVLVAGHPFVPFDAVELYDQDTGGWTRTSSLSAGRWEHTATRLANGNVLVAGGWGTQEALDSAELYVDTTLPAWPIGPGFTGAWFDPAQGGHGLFVEVLSDYRFLAWWFTFNPAGSEQAWFGGVGTYNGNAATITDVYLTTRGRWIPNFDPSRIVSNRWGTLKFTFTDCSHGKVDFDSIAGYGTGSMNLTRLTQPAGLTCP